MFVILSPSLPYITPLTLFKLVKELSPDMKVFERFVLPMSDNRSVRKYLSELSVLFRVKDNAPVNNTNHSAVRRSAWPYLYLQCGFGCSVE